MLFGKMSHLFRAVWTLSIQTYPYLQTKAKKNPYLIKEAISVQKLEKQEAILRP